MYCACSPNLFHSAFLQVCCRHSCLLTSELLPPSAAPEAVLLPNTTLRVQAVYDADPLTGLTEGSRPLNRWEVQQRLAGGSLLCVKLEECEAEADPAEYLGQVCGMRDFEGVRLGRGGRTGSGDTASVQSGVLRAGCGLSTATAHQLSLQNHLKEGC